MKKFKEIIISFFILLIGLLVIEAIIRVMNSDMRNYDIEMWKYAKTLKKRDSVLGHVHKKNETATLQNVEIKLNSLGMRSEEPLLEKKKILFTGSSISLGWGVDNDSSFVGIFRNRLQNQNLDYQVLNASVGNYNTFRYVENFLRNQKKLDPEVIVINYFINDAEILPMGSDNWLLKNSALAASLNLAVKKMTSNSEENLKEYYNRLYDPENKGFQLMHNSLQKLAEYAEGNGTKIYLVIIPDIHFLENYPFVPIHKKIESIAENLNFVVIDTYPSLKGIPFDDLQIMPGDSHPNAYGHRLMAEELSEEILADLK